MRESRSRRVGRLRQRHVRQGEDGFPRPRSIPRLPAGTCEAGAPLRRSCSCHLRSDRRSPCIDVPITGRRWSRADPASRIPDAESVLVLAGSIWDKLAFPSVDRARSRARTPGIAGPGYFGWARPGQSIHAAERAAQAQYGIRLVFGLCWLPDCTSSESERPQSGTASVPLPISCPPLRWTVRHRQRPNGSR